MKNIYTIFVLVLLTAHLHAQMTISFEESEDFELGNIHNQNGWKVTEFQGTGFVVNQVVNNEMASDGVFSFKNAFEPDHDFQTTQIIGASKIFDTALDYTSFSITYDIFITGIMGANFELIVYAIADEEPTPIAGVGMVNDGEIYVIKDALYNSDPIDAEWEPNTWLTIKIEVNQEEVKYYVEEELQYTLDNFSQSNIYGIRMLHNNYGHDAYYDNIRITSSTLGVEDQESENIKIYPNPTSDFINLQLQSSQNLKEVVIYNITGKQVSIQNTSKVDFRSLAAGTYIIKISLDDGQSLIRKVIKK